MYSAILSFLPEVIGNPHIIAVMVDLISSVDITHPTFAYYKIQSPWCHRSYIRPHRLMTHRVVVSIGLFRVSWCHPLPWYWLSPQSSIRHPLPAGRPLGISVAQWTSAPHSSLMHHGPSLPLPFCCSTILLSFGILFSRQTLAGRPLSHLVY